MRKIPVTMATQHPDNATTAYFLHDPFVTTSDEVEECYRCFAELGVDEYMWDWEGKFVDEAVIDRLFQQRSEYFKKHPLGHDKFLTYRIPNIWEESSHRLPRSFINIISAEHAAKEYGMAQKPLFEVILPMTTSVDQLMYLQKTFNGIANASEQLFQQPSEIKLIDIIPLFEEVETMAVTDKILDTYLKYMRKEFNHHPEYMRVFLARSDPAMNAGLLPCMLAVKSAISTYHAFGEKNNITIFPWVGGGSLPFRGGINPENIPATIEEYKGVSSLTVQSAFRYDYPLDSVKKAIKKLNTEIPKNRTKHRVISTKEAKQIKQFNEKAKLFFQETIESIAPMIVSIAEHIPSRRERVQHVGLTGYSRGVGSVSLPRAIKFTASLYSLGVPPEFIGMGRGLELARSEGMLPLVQELYINIIRDLQHAGHYLNYENLEILAKKHDGFAAIKHDIELCQSILGIELKPIDTHHMLHRNITSNILHAADSPFDVTDDIVRAAVLRKSLG